MMKGNGNNAPVDTGVDPCGKYDTIGQEHGIGEARFKAIRAEWSRARPKSTAATTRTPDQPPTLPTIDVSAVCEVLQNNKMLPFPSRVPLVEVIDILVEMWEDEGLFD